MSTDWQQIWSEDVSKLTSITVPFCFHSVDKICSHNKMADWHQKSSKTCWQNLTTDWRQKSSRLCFY